MNALLSIVSHGHQELIPKNGIVQSPGPFRILVRENIPHLDWVPPGGVRFIQNLRIAGFGANHNRNFESAQLDGGDWFVICNPDVDVTADQLSSLLSRAEQDNASLVAPLLWNRELDEFDHNIRPRPTPVALALSFMGLPSRSRYKDSEVEGRGQADWASGAFLAIKAGVFRHLGGFDERYFMYMEDVDLCERASRARIPVCIYPDIRVIHNAARANRNLFSMNFAHHLRSALRYFVV